MCSLAVSLPQKKSRFCGVAICRAVSHSGVSLLEVPHKKMIHVKQRYVFAYESVVDDAPCRAGLERGHYLRGENVRRFDLLRYASTSKPFHFCGAAMRGAVVNFSVIRIMGPICNIQINTMRGIQFG